MMIIIIGFVSCQNDPIKIIGSRVEALPKVYYDLEELLLISEYSKRTNRIILVNFKDKSELSKKLTKSLESNMLNYISDSMFLVNMSLSDTTGLRTVRKQENSNKSKGVLNSEFKTKHLNLNSETKAVTLNSELEIINLLTGLESKDELAIKLRSVKSIKYE